MLVELGIAAGFYAVSHVYHRIKVDGEAPVWDPVPPLQVPLTEPGTPVPLVFGRCRVRRPILSWHGELNQLQVYIERDGDSWFWTNKPVKNIVAGSDEPNEPSHRVYAIDLLFRVGIGMGTGTTRGNSLAGNKLHNVWWGDRKLPSPGSLPSFASTMRYGQMVSRETAFGGPGRGGGLRGAYYWHGGWTDQSLTAPASKIGDRYGAAVGASLVPGLAKQMLVSFVRMPKDSADPYFNQTVPDVGGTTEAQPLPQEGFILGEANAVTTISVEVSSYGDVVSGTSQHIFAMSNPGVDFGGDADPIEVIYDVLTNPNGKLGLPTSLIDMTSFGAASQTLKSEGIGYSRAVESTRPARDCLEDVLRHVDGVVRFNRRTRKFEVKLIRPDYDPAKLPKITRKNCDKLTGAAISGWSGVITDVRVVYSNRAKDYEDDSEPAQNPAEAGEERNEEVLHFPGCTRAALAKQLAERELAWRSKPLMKLVAHVDRSFLRVAVGDPVMVNWTDPNISNVVFRVAAVNHGTLTDGQIILTLVQDANYVWRNLPPQKLDYGSLGVVPGLDSQVLSAA